eukprot:GSMAST32.ASY1.ANO1.1413.1 assembled CDS
MADVVRELVEQMVPELEDLEILGILSPEEIRKVVKQRRKFEYLLKNRTTSKVDYLKYIEYEVNLEALRQKRKQRLGIRKHSISDHAGRRRIHHIFERALRRYKEDVRMWLQYAAFCQRTKSRKVLSKLFPKALQIHPRCTGLWIQAAAWEYSDNGNVSGARALLQRGLRINEESEQLWLEYFRLELLYVHKMATRRATLGLDAGSADIRVMEDGSEPLNASFYRGVVPQVVYKNACRSLPNKLKLRKQFLDICDTVPECPKELKQAIISSISLEFPDDADAIILCARMHQHSYKSVDKNIFEDAILANSNSSESMSTSAKLWRRYVEFIAERLKICVESQDQLKIVQEICSVCERATNSLEKNNAIMNADDIEHAAEILQIWAGILLRCGKIDEAITVVIRGETICPSDSRIWLLRIDLAKRAQVLGYKTGCKNNPNPKRNIFCTTENISDLYTRSFVAVSANTEGLRMLHMRRINDLVVKAHVKNRNSVRFHYEFQI